MAHLNNLRLLFLTISLLLASLTTAQYDFQPEDEASPSPQPELSAPAPSPFSSSQGVKADVSLSPLSEISAPIQSPSQQGDSQSPSPSPSSSSSEDDTDLDNSYVDAPPASKEFVYPGPGAPFYGYGSEYSPFSVDSATNELTGLRTHVNPMVKEICESTDSPSLCQSTIGPLVKKDDADVPTVVKAALEVTSKLADEGSSLAKSAAVKSGNPPEMAPILKDCGDVYDDAADSFAKARAAFAQGDVSTAKSVLSAVITDVGDCEDALAKAGLASPFGSLSEKLANMTGNCLEIVSLVG